MTYTKVLEKLNQGFAVRRSAWPQGQYLALDGLKRPVICKNADSQATWPSHDDITACDWKVYLYKTLSK